MGWGFDNSDKTTAVSLQALRGQAMQRLAGIELSLENKGIGAGFARAASRPDPVGDMGFLNSLIVDMIMLAPISAFICDHFHGVTEGFNVAAASTIEGAVEGVAVLRDERYQSRRLSDYPEGRRACALEAARAGKSCTLVSGYDHNRFSFSAQAELACMFEIIDMLDRLEKEGVTQMRLDPQKPVYDVLKQTEQKRAPKNAVRSFAAPVLMTA